MIGSRITAAILLLAHGVHGFDSQYGNVYSVPANERLSDKQLYARDINVYTKIIRPILFLDLNVSGLVYVSYSEKPKQSSAKLATVKVSGSSEGVTNYISVESPRSNTLTLTTLPGNYTPTSDDAMLVEIELFYNNTLTELTQRGSSDVVVLKDVLMNPGDNLYGIGHIATREYSTGNIFLSDPTGEIKTDGFDIDTYMGASVVQIELATINAKKLSLPLGVFVGERGQVKLFIDKLAEVDAEFQDEKTAAGNTLCIAAKNDVSVSTSLLEGNSATAKVVPAGTACERLALPKRVPVSILGKRSSGSAAGNSAANSSSNSNANSTTASPVASAPPTTVPTSSAPSFRGLAVVVVAFLAVVGTTI